jgi:hypothetical protein
MPYSVEVWSGNKPLFGAKFSADPDMGGAKSLANRVVPVVNKPK